MQLGNFLILAPDALTLKSSEPRMYYLLQTDHFFFGCRTKVLLFFPLFLLLLLLIRLSVVDWHVIGHLIAYRI